MLEKISTTSMVLIGLALLAGGLFIGSKWNTWFPPSQGGTQIGGKAKACKDDKECPNVAGVDEFGNAITIKGTCGTQGRCY